MIVIFIFGDIVENSSDIKYFWFIEVFINFVVVWEVFICFWEKVVNVFY